MTPELLYFGGLALLSFSYAIFSAVLIAREKSRAYKTMVREEINESLEEIEDG